MMVVLAEFRRHAALPLDAALERYPGQLAGEVITPAVIDAGDLLAVTLLGQAQEIAAMGAAVDEGVDRAVRAARHNDRDLADCRGDPVAGLRDLRRQAQIAPGRPFEDLLLLEPVLLGIGVDPEGHLAERVGREAQAAVKSLGNTGILHGHGSTLFAKAIGCAEYALPAPRSSSRPTVSCPCTSGPNS